MRDFFTKKPWLPGVLSAVMCLALLAGLLANLAGTVCVNIVFFALPLIPLLLSLCVAAFSGGLGGVLSWLLLTALRRFGVGKRRAK